MYKPPESGFTAEDEKNHTRRSVLWRPDKKQPFQCYVIEKLVTLIGELRVTAPVSELFAPKIWRSVPPHRKRNTYVLSGAQLQGEGGPGSGRRLLYGNKFVRFEHYDPKSRQYRVSLTEPGGETQFIFCEESELLFPANPQKFPRYFPQSEKVLAS